jgi:hypothetical protein
MATTKKDLQNLISELENILKDSIETASKAAKEYSTDPRSRAEFEVGYLNGYIETVLKLIEEKKV